MKRPRPFVTAAVRVAKMGVCRRTENGHGQQELDEADRDDHPEG